MSGDSLSFDPNEPVVPFGTEAGRPLRKPQPTATAEAAQPQQQRPAVSPQRAAQRAIVTEGKPQPQTPRTESVVVEEPEAPVAVPVTAAPRARLPLVSQQGPRNVTPAFEDVWLPSEFVSYQWKDIQVRRFNVEEIRAIVRARISGNLRHLVRAVDNTLSRPVTDLTVGDFWYLLYWHRLNSYKKSPFVIEWVCDAEDHLRKVAGADLHEGEESLDPKTLRNLLTVNKSNLDTISIDRDAYNDLATQLYEEYGIQVQPQGIVDFVSATDEDEEIQHRRDAEKKKREAAAAEGDVGAFLDDQEQATEDDDRSFMYRYAALLSTTHGETLSARSDFLSQQSPDLLVDLEALLEIVEHGVKESWTVTCKECGASKTIKQSLDALTFLPSLQRGGLA